MGPGAPAGGTPTGAAESVAGAPQHQLQLDTAAGAVVPAGPLSALLAGGVQGLSEARLGALAGDRALLRRADEFVKGLQVDGGGRP